MRRADTNASAVLRNNDPLYPSHATHWHPTQKSLLFSLYINVDCDKGILTMSASLCLILSLFHSSSSLLSLRPLFYLRWIVIMWSKRAPPSPLNEKRGTKSSSVHMKKEKKRRKKARVFPLFCHSLSASQQTLTRREKCSRSAVTRTGAPWWDRPAPGALNRGPSKSHSGDMLSLPSEDLRPGLGFWRECLFWRVCVFVRK